MNSKGNGLATPITLSILPIAYERTEAHWLGDFKPYVYQWQIYERVEEALRKNETLGLFLVTPTGSGKTLGSYAYAIRNQLSAIGVYPTNELIRDQEQALQGWFDPYEKPLLRIDSTELDRWEGRLGESQHSAAFETLMGWRPTILTNPDILFYIFFGLYGGRPGVGERLWTSLGEYRLFIFDEFHLYNVKQMADVAFLVGTLHTINPHKGRVFVFASATPDSPALTWLRTHLGLNVEIVEGQPSDAPDARVIAHPLELVFLPADLGRWKGAEALLTYLPELQQFVSRYPLARVVTILDSVAGAISLAQAFRETFPGKTVGEVHGFSSDEEREKALRQSITVGTSTIEVGIDFQGETEKDVLIYEARTASQFIQRFGRLARHEKVSVIPNKAVALVPEYVYHFVKERMIERAELSRARLYDLMNEAYHSLQDFPGYLRVHAPAEFDAARRFITRLFQPDDSPRIVAGLEQLIEALTGDSAGRAAGKRRRYEESGILRPLLTFRGSGFEAAILDERGSDQGFPAKRYNLVFLLRRGLFTELDEDEYLGRLKELADRWPDQITREQRYAKHIGRQPEELLGVYGYFVLNSLLDRGRKVWFEVSEEEVMGRKGQVTVITGLEMATEPEVSLRRLNRYLHRKQIVAWFMDSHPASIKLGRALPPLFEIYELRVRRLAGGLSQATWSIAFNQDAFFVDSLGWTQRQREDGPIIL